MADIVNQNLKQLGKTFVINARKLRVTNNLSCRAMARAVSVSDSTIRRIEGVRKTRFGKGQQGYIPSLATVVKLAEAADLSPAQLLTEKL